MLLFMFSLNYQMLQILKNINTSQHFYHCAQGYLLFRQKIQSESNITVLLFVQIIFLPLKLHSSEQHLSAGCLCHQYNIFSSKNGSYSASVGQLNFSHTHEFLFAFLLSRHEFFISRLMRHFMCLSL